MSEINELLELGRAYVIFNYVISIVFGFVNVLYVFRNPLRHLWWRIIRKKEKQNAEDYENFDMELEIVNEKVRQEQQQINDAILKFKPKGFIIFPHQIVYENHKYHLSYDNSIYVFNDVGNVIAHYSNCQIKFY